MCVELLQQGLVLLICHLLYQKLHSNEHADVHVTCWQLNTHTQTKDCISLLLVQLYAHLLADMQIDQKQCKHVVIMYTSINHDKTMSITHLYDTDKRHVGMGEQIHGLFAFLSYTGCGYSASSNCYHN